MLILLAGCSKPLKNSPELYLAAEQGNLEKVNALIQSGHKVDAMHTKDILGLKMQRTPLMIAAAKGHLDIVKLLVQNGDNVNALSIPSKETSLIKAINGDNVEVVKYLLQNGANVNMANKWGKTPLMWATQYKRKNIIPFLLKAGADKDLQDEKGQRAADFIEKNKYPQIFQLLQK